MTSIAVSDETGTRISLDSERTLILSVFDGNHHSNPRQLFDEGGVDALPDDGWQITLERRSDVIMEYVLDSGSLESAVTIWYKAVQSLSRPTLSGPSPALLLNDEAALYTASVLRTHFLKRQAEAATREGEG